MIKRVFFSLCEQDVAEDRVSVVRSHWLSDPDHEAAGCFDMAAWENARSQGDASLKSHIDGCLQRTSTTCVLIGSETYANHWVRYEIMKSFVKGDYLLGVQVNGIKDVHGKNKPLSPNPFDYLGLKFSTDGNTVTLMESSAGGWILYKEIDETADHAVSQLFQPYRGRSYRLSHFYFTYDWLLEDGHGNFTSWVR